MGAEVGDEVVLVNPSEIVEIMKKVPLGKVLTLLKSAKKLPRQTRSKVVVLSQREFL